MLEWAKYSAYGVPFGLPGGDTNSDGDCDTTDATQIQTWINAPAYDVRGDLDLDGDVDTSDKSIAQSSPWFGSIAGHTILSTLGESRRGLSGACYQDARRSSLGTRARLLCGFLGRWLTRDPLHQIDGSSLYQFVMSRPLTRYDPSGLCSLIGGNGNNPPPPPPPPGPSSNPSGGLIVDLGPTEKPIYDELGWTEKLCVAAAGAAANTAGWITDKAGGDGNRMRHCMLSCGLSDCAGTNWAKRMTDAHEVDAPGTAQDTAADQAANRMGRACSLSLFSCLACCTFGDIEPFKQPSQRVPSEQH